MTNKVAVPSTLTASMMERVVVQGDIGALSPKERLIYYKSRCEAAGLDPRTEPFGYIKTKEGGKERVSLYAKKAAAEQIARRLQIGVTLDYHKREGAEMPIYMVKARGICATDKRVSEDIGCVPLFRNVFIEDADQKKPAEGSVRHEVWAYDPGAGRRTKSWKWGFWETKQFVGEELCNAMLKCVTKAKRRVILSMAGLGMSDESEIESMEAVTVDAETLAPESDDDLAPWDLDDSDEAARNLAEEWVARFQSVADSDELSASVKEMEDADLLPVLGPALLETVTDAFTSRMVELEGSDA